MNLNVKIVCPSKKVTKIFNRRSKLIQNVKYNIKINTK